MSDYNIKIGVDSRSASRGVKQFAADLNGALKALRDFDKRASDAFKALERFSKLNTSNLGKSAKTIASAVREINNLKISRALVNNLQSLQKALSGLRFSSKNNLAALPRALNGLQSVKINPKLVSSLAQIKATLRGFSGPPKSLAALPPLLRQLGAIRINSGSAQALAALKAALAGFHGPSAKAGDNLRNLIHAMSGANAGQIAAVAAALQRLNGLSINIGRTLANVGKTGGRSFTNMASGIKTSHYAMRLFDRQMSMTYHAANLLQAALGGVTTGTIINGIYKTGSAFQSLERTLAAVATSSTETSDHMKFLENMTTRIPISLEAAANSYGKFAVAARLSGMTIEDTQNVFEGFSTAFAAMGVSAQTAEFGFMALQQIISKGRVTMEEMRQQLGEHLPGAMQLLAESLGVLPEQLIKMIENGEVGADSLIKFADAAKRQFGPSLASAFNTASGQMTIMENAWIEFKRTVFESGFESGLASMFKSLSDAMKTVDFQNFAKSFGAALGEVFKTLGVLGKLLIENGETVLWFLGVFAGAAAISSFGVILSLVISPLGKLISLFTLAGRAAGLFFAAMGGASVLRAIAGIKILGDTVGLMTSRVLRLAAAAMAAAFALDVAFNDAKGLKSTLSYIGKVSEALGEMVGKGFSSLTGDMGVDSLIDQYRKMMKESDEFAQKVQDNTFENRQAQEENRKREERNRLAKLGILSNEAQELWKLLSPIGEANAEYEKQLKLVEEIARVKGVDAASLKKVLDEQTFEDRNPVGAMARDYRMDLDVLSNKTAEQVALNRAQADYNELLKKGADIGVEGLRALEDYHKGVAMMNGEIGNGIERWTATVGDFNDNLQEAIKDGIGGLSDEITNFVTGAEADFLGLARSILRTFVKISLDSLLKDLFGAMGMNGEQNGQSMAEQALSKLANIGENIVTAQTNVYTSGLSVNGMPLDGGLGDGFKGYGPDWNADIERKPLAPIATPAAAAAAGIPTGTRADPVIVKPLPHPGQNRTGALEPTLHPSVMNDNLPGATFSTFKQGMDRFARDMKETTKTVLDPNINPERFAPAVMPPAMQPQQFAKSITLSNQDIVDLKKTLMTEWVSGKQQGAGIVDTILNRQASGKWGNSIADVVNARKQFSDVNGPIAWKAGRNSVADLSMNDPRYARASNFVDDYLAKRAAGMKSSVGDHLNYANPNYSSKSNLPWINALDGPQFGQGKNIHRHGTTPELQRYRPGEYGINLPGQKGATPAGIDPMATSGIEQVNQKLTQLGTTAQTAGTQVGTAGQKLQQTGTNAQTLGPALQQTASASQQAAMASQQAASATQMRTQSELQMGMTASQVGVQVQTAGMQAMTASPQFQQAGTAIASAGQSAAMGAAQAQAAAPGIDGFGQGITQLLGPLASAIPGLGQFGSMIMQLVQQLFMGPGMGGGLFAEGGLSSSPVSSVTLPGGIWSSAPHFADGTPNTSGGMPAILHPNEAVIPLTRGREVPVEINDGEPRQDTLDKRGKGGVTIVNLNGVTDMDSFRRSKRQLEYGVASAQYRSQFRNG